MKRLIIISVFYFFSAFTHAEVQVQVESSQVSVDEPFQLQLTQINPQAGGGIPDLTPLRKDFLILGTERSMNYSIINGQTQSSSTWAITLKAQKTGALTIPALKVGTEQTPPLTINVTTQPTQTKDVASQISQQQDIFLTTEVNEKKPYLNQQVIYKVTLYNSKQLLDANYQGPKVENALLIPLENGKRYQILKNNVPYLVEEQNYAIFPQKSGPLKISSPVFTALIYDFNPQRIQAETKPITLDVQAVPAQYQGKTWLPAKKIKLHEEYEQMGQTINQGSTLVRTITLEGIGVPAQLLPNLHFADTDAFNVYPEKGQEKNTVTQGEIASRMEMKVTYLFNKSGKVIIPELKLPWFNTTTGKEEVAILAPRSIEVLPSATAPKAPLNPPPVPAHAAPEPSAKTAPPLPITTPATSSNWAWGVAALFALAWFTTLVLWVRQKYGRKLRKGAYKNALNALHTACLQNDPQHARNALLKWANLYWPDASILSLSDVQHLTTDMQLRKQIQRLSQALYQNTDPHQWHGDELWQSINHIKPTPSKTNHKTSTLPPINPA